MLVVYVGGGSAYSTLQQGIEAAEQSGAQTIVVNPGTYAGNGVLGSADDGLTITGGSGVSITGSVIIDNASSITISGISFQGNGSNVAITALDSQNLTITGNKFTGTGQAVVLDGTISSSVSNNYIINTTASAIEARNGATSNVLSSNYINGDGAADTIGAIWLHGADNTTITHNQISNTTGAAISLTDFYGPGTTATQNNGSLISYNNLDNVDTASLDSGAIYILGRSQEPSTNISVTGNLIGTTGSSSPHAVGIYLDDNASGVSVNGNIVVATPSMSDPFEIHGGSYNTISGNIFDLGYGSTTDFGLSQADEANQAPEGSFQQLQHDSITGNIFTTEAKTPHDPGFADLTTGIGTVSIAGNDFWAFSGAPLNVAGTGPTGDTAAHYNPPAAQPALSLSDYSSWSGAGINFRAIDTSQIAVALTDPTLVAEPASILLLPMLILGLVFSRHFGGSDSRRGEAVVSVTPDCLALTQSGQNPRIAFATMLR